MKRQAFSQSLGNACDSFCRCDRGARDPCDCCSSSGRPFPRPLRIVVTTLDDSGPGSLRSAIERANRAAASVIRFAVQGTIELFSPLPAIARKTDLDATASPGDASSDQVPTIEIDCGGSANGLVVEGKRASGTTLAGLAIVNSVADGILVEDAAHVTVFGCRVGVGLDGSSAKSNAGAGIRVLRSNKVRVGLNPRHVSGFASNVVSSNGESGIAIVESQGCTIASNFVGTDSTGQTALGNGPEGGVLLLASSGNQIGGTVDTNSEGVTNNPTGSEGSTAPVTIFPPLGNLVSGNAGDGVRITGGSSRNVLNGNFVGTDATGNAALPNGGSGVLIDSASHGNALIGCTFEDDPFVYYNVLSGNAGDGLTIAGANDTTVQGNFMGAAMSNEGVVPNGGNGIQVQGPARGTQVGGVIPLGNLCAGNAANGVLVTGPEVHDFVSFNTFGGLLAFGGAAPNQGDGLRVEDQFGTGNVVRTCVFSGNVGNGIHFVNASGFTVESVICGLVTRGDAPLPNQGNGILIEGTSSDITVGGDVASVIPQNTLSGNLQSGVKLAGLAARNAVYHCRIGLSVDGISPMPNGENGVTVTDTANNNSIGSTSLVVPRKTTNYVSANALNGIDLGASTYQNLVFCNHVGFDTAELPAPNGGAAIVDAAPANANAVLANFTFP